MFRQSKKRAAQRRSDFATADQSTTYIQAGISFNDEQERYELLYPTKLSFYHLPPIGEITLDQFETWAIDRLKVLLELESLAQRNKNIKEMEQVIKPILASCIPLSESLESRKKDYYSHFILRLCFCRSKDLREKFLHAETILFKLRFQMLTQADQTKFVQSLNLPLLQFISDEEKQEIATELYETVSPQLQFQLNLSEEQQRRQFFNHERFIKLPFEAVIDLLGTRQVFLKQGWAYLPQFQQLNHIANEYASRLSDDLLKTYQHIPKLNEDDRLLPILTHLSTGYVVTEHHYSFSDSSLHPSSETTADTITAASLHNPEVRSAFPLCAKNLMDGLSKNNHLKFNGRQQLSFFLKGLGMSVDEALKFWTDAFTRSTSMSLEKFNKEYRYNFRHNYGLEGNRINYRPWDCRTVLSKPRPARGEYHGCPYRDWNPEKLSATLAAMNLTQSQVSSILDSAKRNEFTLACTKAYEFSALSEAPGTANPSEPLITDQTHITHPNLYFDRARRRRT
ncbi:DNA primase subunit PRI2 Ecym_4581 [Eremothecium cymbalariae DBVPG|uniref:DNA primase large subunit n=1 Tax=Eremothecium cymbalariae (strain CBS 270.75 / DBVPG 7215 / KCTC 17166 / NRRL Y-17582) TaxID=931890 RepID=G8JS92_ERECY|nr:hypothetical protein Ecym_4581 [Eremothecium cymbalariae DBVPG\